MCKQPPGCVIVFKDPVSLSVVCSTRGHNPQGPEKEVRVYTGGPVEIQRSTKHAWATEALSRLGIHPLNNAGSGHHGDVCVWESKRDKDSVTQWKRKREREIARERKTNVLNSMLNKVLIKLWWITQTLTYTHTAAFNFSVVINSLSTFQKAPAVYKSQRAYLVSLEYSSCSWEYLGEPAMQINQYLVAVRRRLRQHCKWWLQFLWLINYLRNST